MAKGLYDSYIRAIRWASDRIGNAGVVAYVSNAGWVENNTTDGLRQCLADEFANIYVFHLRGNTRTSGERARREGGQTFGSGSRTPVAIAILVKNPAASAHGQIFFRDIGDYLTREDKLATVAKFGSIGGVTGAGGWQTITPDEHGDWLGQRDKAFDAFMPIGDKKGGEAKIFENFSQAVLTARDSWAFNASRDGVANNMRSMISVYNAELARFNDAHSISDRKKRADLIDGFIDTDPTKISWTRALKGDLAKDKRFAFDEACLTPSLYRPFTRQWLYYSRTFNEMIYQIPRIFPDVGAENRVIMVKARWHDGSLALMTRDIPAFSPDGGEQCFPRYLYDGEREAGGDAPQGGLFAAEPAAKGGRRDAITDDGLAHFQAAYPGETITKDDLFHYVYGLLHSEDYRERFADNLSKQLPRIPAVKQAADFWAFVEAGRRLGDLHCDFDSADLYPVTFARGDTGLAPPADPVSFYRVEKMKHGGKRPNVDKTTIIYNANITVTDIPLEAYDYVVNGKSAIDWVMERQCVKTDKASGIVNDANRFAIETMNDPAYPLKLLQRVITVSLETMKIVRGLPRLDIA